MNTDQPSTLQEKPDDRYARAIGLMQYEIQTLWVIFGIFLLAETVLLGGIGNAFKGAPKELLFGGALLGLLLVIPWWTTFEYRRSFYLLRIAQAKQFENEEGFLTEGQRLGDGKPVRNVRINCFVRLMRPQHAAWVLMGLFAIAFLLILVVTLVRPSVVPPASASHARFAPIGAREQPLSTGNRDASTFAHTTRLLLAVTTNVRLVIEPHAPEALKEVVREGAPSITSPQRAPPSTILSVSS